MATSPAQAPSTLFSREHLPLAVGAVALVTLGAFENRAVGTALPTLVREFDAIGSFGLANAAPVASYAVSLAIAGVWADRSGPVSPLRAGVLLFAVAQVLVGTAVGMPQVIAGRLLSGLAEGLIDVGIMVLVARALPERLRPRMFSLFAAAWVLPSVIGPFLTGVVTEGAGWRWVFLGALAILVPTWLLIQPAIRAARDADARSPSGRPSSGTSSPGVSSPAAVLPWAATAAAAVFGLTLAGDHLEAHPVAVGAAVAVCSAATALAALRLLPAGTFRLRRGLPTVVAQRGFAAAAFGASGAWLPLLLTLVHGFGPTTAGISLSITGVSWAFGSWLQGRDHGFARVTVLRTGMATMTAGIAIATSLAWPDLPPAVGLTGWAVAGIGMGLTSPVLSLLILDGSDDTNQGRNVSAGHLAGSLSTAAAFAIGGTAIAFAAPSPGPATFGVILAASAGVALAGLLSAGRVTVSPVADDGDR
ncbi:MFS transporter [Jiangella asiatica]|uniref:MFS transporter n=1 Tax=Jiangella asiatica TaxID=2530372 RepID=A0A4R5DHE0_9ACTN|nr:MFS transporter [Jiangella asiatica]TDE12667.1 MFS transporter [Jiangella asiatica]